MLITVVIPTRNRLALLHEAIESVERQSPAHWEAIVVDDASEDGTRQWLADRADDRVRPVYLERHLERSAARNRGLALARGELVLFLDDDDRLLPSALEQLASALRRAPRAVAAIGARIEFDEEGNRRRLPHARRPSVRAIWPDVLAAWQPGWFLVTGQCLFRVGALRTIGGWNEELVVGEDQEIQLRLSRLGPSALVSAPTLEHRLHGGQWRPRDTAVVEEGFRRGFVAGLEGAEHELASRLLVAGERLRSADEAYAARNFLRALALYAGGARSAPPLLVSPLLRRSLVRVLARAAIGAIVGRRAAGTLRAASRTARRLRGRTEPERRMVDR